MRIQKQDGFSLVEIIAALAIIGIIAAAIFTAIGIINRNQMYATQLQHNTQIGQTVMANLANEKHLPQGETYAGMSDITGEYPTYQGTWEGNQVAVTFSDKQSLDEQASIKIQIKNEQNSSVCQLVQRTSNLCVTGELKISYNQQEKKVMIGTETLANVTQMPLIIELNQAEATATQITIENQMNNTELMKVLLVNDTKYNIQTIGNVELYRKQAQTSLGTLYQVEVVVNQGTAAAFVTKSQVNFK